MVIMIGIVIIYLLIIIAAVGGIGYFIIKRRAEKRIEQEILDRDDY